VHDDIYLPTPLTITLNRRDAPEGACRGGPLFKATSPQYPWLSASDATSEDAVAGLLYNILDNTLLASELVEALLGAGYSHELVEAWDRMMRGNNREYRYRPDAALSALREYTDRGVPALTACEYLAIGIEPTAAAQAQAAGGSPQEARHYIDEAETFKWWKWDFDFIPWIVSGFPYERGRLYAYTCSVEQAMNWEAVVIQRGISDADLAAILRIGLTPDAVASGFPTDRVGLYAAHRVAPAQAEAWERVVAKHDISHDDLRDILRAGPTPESVEDGATVYPEGGPSVGDAACSLLALAAPPDESPTADEPPF
jgi:hypothetical protein